MGCCRDENPLQISDPQVVAIDDDQPFQLSAWDHHCLTPFWSNIKVPILVQPIHPQAKAPVKTHASDLGWDIFCVEDEKWHTCWADHKNNRCLELMPHESHTFSTGIKIATPQHYGFLLRERSGLGIQDFNLGAGVIEGTFRGEWKIHIRNLSNKPRVFYVGDKICQAILVPIIPAETQLVDNLPSTERGEKGFGSSGR